MMAHAIYREFRVAELRRQDLLKEAMEVHGGRSAAARGARIGVAVKLRHRFGGLLMRAGDALQGATGTKARPAIHAIESTA